jgi:hypothetical protein
VKALLAVVTAAALVIVALAAPARADTWAGTVTLAASPTFTDVNSRTSTLTVTLSQPIPPGAAIPIYDQNNGRVAVCYVSGCTTTVTPATNTTYTYTAYVGDYPAIGPPTSPLATSAPVSVTNVGWTGSISLTPSTSTTDVNSRTSTLTVTLTQAIPNWLYVPIYDQNNSRVAVCYASGCTTTVTPATNTTNTYTAYIAGDYPVTGPPTSPLATSASVSVTNVGWTGSISLTPSTPTTDANSRTSTLTVTLTQAIPNWLYVPIYDQNDSRVAVCYASGCTTTVTPATNTTNIYTAYIAGDYPVTGPPPSPLATSAPISVTNVGWTGTVSMAASATNVSTANPSTVLTISISKPLVGGLIASVYDEANARVGTCSASCTMTVVPPPGVTKTYTAYIAYDSPAGQVPLQDVRSTASVTYTTGTLTSTAIEGVDPNNLADYLIATGVSVEDIDAAFLDFVGTHFEESSLTDQQLEFDAAIHGGATIADALKAAAKYGGLPAGGTLLWFLSTQFSPQVTSPPPPTDSQPPTGPTFGVKPPVPGAATYEDDLTNDILMSKPSYTHQQARIAAEMCVQTAQFGIATGSLSPSINGKYPCSGLPIFMPGGENPATTQHDYNAIFGTSQGVGNPEWVLLNYVSSADRTASGLSRGWAQSQPACAGQTGGATGLDCDEYPYFSSAQSGPGASLLPVPLGQNRSAGSKYGWFTRTCGLQSGGPVAAQQAANGSPFLVVPMAFSGAPPTAYVCR